MEQQKVERGHLQKQGLFFLIVGSLTAFVHFLSLIFFVQVLNIEPVFANIFAFLIAFVFGFTGHFRLTFQTIENKANWKVSLNKWFMSSIFGFLLNQMIFALGINYFGQQYYIFIWIVATFLVTICTFILAKCWAFKGKHQS